LCLSTCLEIIFGISTWEMIDVAQLFTVSVGISI